MSREDVVVTVAYRSSGRNIVRTAGLMAVTGAPEAV